MVETILKELDVRMQKTVESFKGELSKMRTGRANTAILEHIRVSYYGNEVPLNQTAVVAVEDARTLRVAPWDKSMVTVIEKAILQSDLGLNPVTAGQVIRVPIPSMTEERRIALVKLVRAEAEKARVGIRNIRRDANNEVKSLLKDKALSEDEAHRAEDRIQKMTDKFVDEIDHISSDKETDVLSV